MKANVRATVELAHVGLIFHLPKCDEDITIENKYSWIVRLFSDLTPSKTIDEKISCRV